MRKILPLLAALGIAATACSSDDPTGGPDDGPDPRDEQIVLEVDGTEVVLTSSLSGFDSCDALLQHLRTEGAERVGPYGFDDGFHGGPVPADAMFDGDDGDAFETSAPVTRGDDTAALVEGVDFSGTNIQEQGVDEADIVKTDGERIYIVANRQLIVVDVAARQVTGTVDLRHSEQSELFLSGDDVLHVSYGWSGWYGPEPMPLLDDVAVEVDAEASFADDVEGVSIAPDYWEGPRSVITRIDVSDGTPEVLESLEVEGEYVSSRAVDGITRIVLRSNPQYDFPFVYPASPAGEDRAEESNREALRNSELSDWLPAYTRFDANGSSTGEGLLPACEQVHAPTEFAGFGVLSVLTVPVNGAIDPRANSSVLAPGHVVYSSPQSVFIATTAWFDPVVWDEADWREIQEKRRTSIHRFDISSPSSAAYTASGSVPGDVRDSFSMSEHEGHLRVITTTGDPWSDTSETFVRVLRETAGELVEVGSVGNMGRGEAVQSVRFQGDIGYVVTFEQVDPFYTLDLSDPENPAVRGELKIPGFSSYLHPIGDGLVLGVGSDADATGRVTGNKVSLFDVSDLDNPTEIAVWTTPQGWNNVGWDTHAFLWWAPENLAVIPMELWNGQQWAGAVVLRVEDRTITEVGRIDHADDDVTPGETECRPIGPEELPTRDPGGFETEFEYIIVEEGALMLACEPDQKPAATGFDCWEEPWFTEEATRLGLVTDEEHIVTCWPRGDYLPQILRSIVLPGGELWTVSSSWGWLGGEGDARLQVNDLTSLERLDVVRL